MNRILEHEVDEVGIRLHEIVKLLQILQLSAFPLVKNIEVVLGRVQLHILKLRGQVGLLLGDLLVALLELLLLFLQRANLLVNLLLHHLIEVLLLDLELLHYAPEGLLQPIDLVVELLPHLQLQLGIQLLAGGRLVLVDLDLIYHLLYHALHIQDFG